MDPISQWVIILTQKNIYIIVYADKCQYDDEWLFLTFFTSSHPRWVDILKSRSCGSACYFVYNN